MTKRTATKSGAEIGRHAIVVGGSLAGLLAARVLTRHFARVTIVERDRFPDGPEERRGVPQASHAHVLLLRGRRILRELLPELETDLASHGAPVLDLAGDVAWLTPAGWGVRFASNLEVRSCSRTLLDWAARNAVLADSRIGVLDEGEVVGLLADPHFRSVRGAQIRVGRAEMNLSAELVVDASGRGSRAPRWLAEAGFEAPRDSIVDAQVAYASRVYATPGGYAPGWKGLYIQADPPRTPRVGMLLPIEGGRWIASLGGGSRDWPPTDEPGFLEFAKSLRSRALYDALRHAEPLGPIRASRATENRWRHYEEIECAPEGFVALGDAACAFNPVYTQGMTVAALGALALKDCLERHPRERMGLSQALHARLAKLQAAPWMVATSEDQRYRGVEGVEPNRWTRLMQGYVNQVVRLSTRDAEARLELLRSVHMLQTPRALLRPAIMARVIAQRARRNPPSAAISTTRDAQSPAA